MRDFKPGDRSRDRRDSPRRSFGGRDSGRPSLHDAVCDECGKNCQVPFRPSGEKPVYCSDCFEKKGGSDSNRSRDRRDSPRRSFGGRDSGRPSQSNINNRTISQLVEKIGILNTKLDRIISLLSSAGEKKSDLVEGRTGKNKKSESIKVAAGNELSGDQNTEKKKESQPEVKVKPKENSKKLIAKS